VLSNDGLRQTSAMLAYRYSRDMRAVQDMVGHQYPKATARYACVVDRARTNPAPRKPVELIEDGRAPPRLRKEPFSYAARAFTPAPG
jgi:hypothetical protein